MRLISAPLTLGELQEIATLRFGDLVKGVVDIEKKIMAIGGELHADEEALLLAQGSLQQNLWGINLYPAKPFPEMVEFDSMINIRPSQNNRSRSVEDKNIQKVILEIVGSLIKN
ncbi:MAG: hypothetical protein HY983_01525 [Candidatus Magasanikbacteria bacterium]|nr:hypothetical protein [Candidatus Magasanikbacteria bacterium]